MAHNIETHDWIGTPIVIEGRRDPSPYTHKKDDLRAGDIVKLNWTGDPAMPGWLHQSDAKIIKVNRTRIRIQPVISFTPYDVKPEHIGKVIYREGVDPYGG